MHILVGIIVAMMGAAIAVFGPRFGREVGSRSGRRFEASNSIAFRVVGVAMLILGIVYAAGVAKLG
ncbi:hypothetical protein [Streptomyces sp. SGAir0957]